MGRLTQKEKNLKRGTLLHPVVTDAPVIVQSNNVIRAEKITPKRSRKKKDKQNGSNDVSK